MQLYGEVRRAVYAEVMSRNGARVGSESTNEPGYAQVDFGEALIVIVGEQRDIRFLAIDLRRRDGCLVQDYPAESTEAFCEGGTLASSSSAEIRVRSCSTTPEWR
jgi:hypothetical protein